MTESRSVVIERDIPHPADKVWRALTQPHLIQEWLMKSDFKPETGHSFAFTADWGSVDCKVLEVEPQRSLAYSWAAYGLESVVTWTLTPKGAGTHLRMEQAGFQAGQGQAYSGAKQGWAAFLDKLEGVLDRPEA